MKLTNKQIYDYAILMNEAFKDDTQRLPVKINFYLQKNKKILMNLAKDIEESRLEIVNTFGEPIEDGSQYLIPKEKAEEAQKELNDLFNLEQDVDIVILDINVFGDDISLTMSQMEAILFMIN